MQESDNSRSYVVYSSLAIQIHISECFVKKLILTLMLLCFSNFPGCFREIILVDVLPEKEYQYDLCHFPAKRLSSPILPDRKHARLSDNISQVSAIKSV